MKQTFEVFPLNFFLLRNFHFIFLKFSFLVLHGISFLNDTSWSDFFFSTNSHGLSHCILSVNLFFGKCPWVCYGPFPFLKEIFFDCRDSQGQWAYVDRSLLRSLVAKLFFGFHHSEGFISQWFWKGVEESALDIYVIHAIDSIKSPWHSIKMSF